MGIKEAYKRIEAMQDELCSLYRSSYGSQRVYYDGMEEALAKALGILKEECIEAREAASIESSPLS